MDETLQALFEAYQEHPIAYMPIYSRVAGSVTAGILLSQIVYWDGKMQHREFYKIDKDFCEELSMGSSELKNAKKRLLNIGVIGIVRKGIPAKSHYKLNLGKLSDLITTNVKKNRQVSRKANNKMKQKSVTNTDTTQKITQDTNLYAFSSRKGNNPKISINELLENYPSEDEGINKTISYYLEYYRAKTNKQHPKITLEQYQKIVSVLEQKAEEYVIGFDGFEVIVSSWFEDDKVQSNYNIIHFASEGVLTTHYYKSGIC